MEESESARVPEAMECEEEPLSAIQKTHYSRRNEKCIEINTQICKLLLDKRAKHIVRNEIGDVFQMKRKYVQPEQALPNKEETANRTGGGGTSDTNNPVPFPNTKLIVCTQDQTCVNKPFNDSSKTSSEHPINSGRPENSLQTDPKSINNRDLVKSTLLYLQRNDVHPRGYSNNQTTNNVNERFVNAIQPGTINTNQINHTKSKTTNINTVCDSDRHETSSTLDYSDDVQSSLLKGIFCTENNLSTQTDSSEKCVISALKKTVTPIYNEDLNLENDDNSTGTMVGKVVVTRMIYEKIPSDENSDRNVTAIRKRIENQLTSNEVKQMEISHGSELTEHILETSESGTYKKVLEPIIIDLSDDNECNDSVVEISETKDKDDDCLESVNANGFEGHDSTNSILGSADNINLEIDNLDSRCSSTDLGSPVPSEGNLSIYRAHCVFIMVTNQIQNLFRNNSARYIKEQLALTQNISRLLSLKGTPLYRNLIDCGLVRKAQYCATHKYETGGKFLPVKMKLAECTVPGDRSKGVYLGWICHLCRDESMSIFRGSIFEGSRVGQERFIKLIYHWCNQSKVQSVSKLLNISYVTVNKVYFKFRAICTAAVHQGLGRLGGRGSMIQVGFVSLWSFANIVVLGAMDVAKKRVRLQVVELGHHETDRQTMWKIFENFKEIVDEESVIMVCHLTDVSILSSHGYNRVVQANNNYACCNSTVMNYLKMHIAGLFKNTYQLPKEKIQLFLDEVVWRETWGRFPTQAFETFLVNLSSQTVLDIDMLYNLALDRIQECPFMNWSYNNWKENLAKLANANKTANIFNQNESNQTADQKNLAKYFPNTNFFQLRQYYYGYMSPDADLLNQDVKYQLNMICFICSSHITNNISMMKHLVIHALSAENCTAKEMALICYCRYCLKNFPSDTALRCHLNSCDLKPKSNLACRICLSDYTIENKLIRHLKNIHVELEMPYECGVCGFRSSEFKVLVDHFYTIHNGGEYIQCPFCFKVVSIVKNSRSIIQNLYYFYNHIKRHTLDKTTRQCDKCCLRFINDSAWNAHSLVDHNSFKGVLDVHNYSRNRSPILVCESMLMKDKTVFDKYIIERIDRFSRSYYLLNKYNSLIMYGVPEGAKCSECEGNFLEENHFPGYMTCKTCPFSTCCRMAMNEHVTLIHWKTEVTLQTRQIPLDKMLLCECGFQTFSGDDMATHLYKEKKRTAYLVQTRTQVCYVNLSTD